MDHLEHPSRDTWEQRRAWFENVEEGARGGGSFLVSEQACALTADVQAAFCAGAWAAVIVLAMAVVDAALREVEVPGLSGNTKDLIAAAGANHNLQTLRLHRNALVHVNPVQPALTVDGQWTDRAELEREACSAVRSMFEAFYLSPGT
jgi:hypothetical protein